MISTTDSSVLARFERRNGKFVNFMSIIVPTPYYWDPKKQELVYQRTLCGRRLLFGMFFALSIGYDLFSLYTCKRAWENANVTPFAKVRVYYMSYGYIVMTISNWYFITTMGRHHGVYNALAKFNRNFQATVGLDARPVESLMFRCHFMIMFLFVFVLSNALEVFLNPDSYRLLTSLAANPKGLSLPIKLMLFVVHVEINAFKFYSSIFQLCNVTFFMFMVQVVLDKIRHVPRSLERDLHNLPFDQIVHKYNQIRLIQTWLADAQGKWLLTTVTYSTILIILSIYQAVIFAKVRPAIIVVGFSITLGFIVHHCGNVYETSVKVQESWRLVKAPLWFHKWVRSCQPARIKLGSFFYIDKGLKLTLMDIILNQSINLVVSYGN